MITRNTHTPMNLFGTEDCCEILYTVILVLMGWTIIHDLHPTCSCLSSSLDNDIHEGKSTHQAREENYHPMKFLTIQLAVHPQHKGQGGDMGLCRQQ